jgi:ferric-dicitrate binding protein FerR (iron transport regulator)
MRVPFLVKAGKGTIQVLGTKFNVSNYSEEKSMVTTLLEGVVKVTAAASPGEEKLSPGQQAVLSNSTSSLSVNDADAEGVISWTRGDFYFDKADLQYVMRQLARWYDITVVYDDPGIQSMQRTFQGTIQRNLPLSEVLPQLERIGNVRLTITGTTVHVNRALK